MLAGLFFRLVAAFFSKGYGWHDDQFLVVEVAQSWVDGIDYYKWLPSPDGLNEPQGFSFFYVGLHYLLFSFFKLTGLTDPQLKMIFIRLLHALWSMLTVFFGYKIAYRLGDRRSAVTAGWMLAVFWIFPFLAVRNLVEFFSVPFLMWGLWLLVDNETERHPSLAFAAGVLFGFAFDTRFQTSLISGMFGLALLFQGRWKEVLWTAAGALVSILLVQGMVDYLVWEKPFTQVVGYITYNATHANDYTVGPWYVYVAFLLGILIPPVSLFLFIGTFKSWRKLLILFLPVVFFIVFHSFYPNKQERFIVTIIPFLMIAGVIGWDEIAGAFSGKSWHRAVWRTFWILNFILLVPVSLTYSKKARVESMDYLRKYRNTFDYFVIDDIQKSVLGFPPQFYLKKYMDYYALLANNGGYRSFYRAVEKGNVQSPGFILFYHDDDLDARVDSMKAVFPHLAFEIKIEPGNVDKILFWLNPVNDNQNIYIYRNLDVVPTRKP